MAPRRAVEFSQLRRSTNEQDAEAALPLRGDADDDAHAASDADGSDSGSDDERDVAAAADPSCATGRSPLDSAPLLSRLAFAWMAPLLRLGCERQLDAADVPPLPAAHTPAAVRRAFRAAWRATGRAGAPNTRLARALLTMEGPTLLRGAAAKFTHDTVMFAAPAALHALLTHLSSGGAEPPPAWAAAIPAGSRGGFYVAVLALTALMQTLCMAQYFHHGYAAGMRARAAITQAVVAKSLRLAPGARAAFTSGEVTTFLAADAKRLQDAAPYAQMVWSGPYQIILSVAMLWSTLGPAFWAGVGVIGAIIPLSGALSSVMVRLQKRLMAAKDARVSRIAEALGAMKLLKAAGWETGFGARITAARTTELAALRMAVGAEMFFGVLWECIPLLVALVSFLVYTRAGGTLTAPRVFTSLALFDVIRFPLLVFPELVTQLASTAVSLRRLQAYLEAAELPRQPRRKSNDITAAAAAAAPVAEAEDATLAWAPDGPPVLAGVRLRIAPGELVCVLGSVGSGKSTLCAALLGELPPRRGTARLRGRVAYCSQVAFIVAATLRDNILFGAPMDEARYAAVLAAAALGPDLAALPRGDATRIGEHGVNLSGGQRQRVALARAAYRVADVYVLDDPLSAVDAAVGRHIFGALLGPGGLLAGAARLLVTHGAQYCPQADRLLLLADGRIAEEGTFAQLLAKGDAGRLTALLQLQGEAEPAATAAEPAGVAVVAVEAVPPSDGEDWLGLGADLVVPTAPAVLPAAPPAALPAPPPAAPPAAPRAEPPADEAAAAAADAAAEDDAAAEEARREGRVDASVYLYYLQAAGYLQSAGVVALFAAWTGLLAGSKLWLARWAAAGGRYSAHWAGGYGGLGAAALGVLLARQALRTHSQLRGGTRLHAQLLRGVLRARLSFFAATPSGRILNRFAGDAATADERLHDDGCDALRQACAVATTACVVGAVSPPLLLGLPPLGIGFGRVQRRYVASARELQRLESVARSPIFSGASEAWAGAATIRAFREQSRVLAAHADAVGANMRAYFAFQSANRWLALRTESLAACVVCAAAAAALRAGSSIDAGLAGLSISYAMSVCYALSWLVRAMAMVETEIVSVERMKEFSEAPCEPPLVLPDSRPPPGWPSTGALALRDVSMRYAPRAPRVLRGVTLDVPGGAKVGVVGRTGAGKSSLLLVLLRLADAEGMSGTIAIDGLDTASVGVGDLRAAVAVIPQEGTLFAGTLRFNLDPLGAHGDDALRAALALVGLLGAPGPAGCAPPARSLDDDVAEEGGNWSAGQRQLLCLARAALRSSRVVLADEATSACDAATDALMQAAMRKAFAKATVLTVAHRLGTVADCDRVLVMHAGAVAEYDAPATLAARPDGAYARLLAEAARAHGGAPAPDGDGA